MTTLPRLARVCVLLVIASALPACETGGQTGALTGAGLGALIGQAAGGDTGATLIGAGIGTGIGYMFGNEQDKKKARQMSQSRAEYNYTHTETGSLGGTRWNLVSLAPRDYVDPYTSKVIEFRPDGYVATTTTEPDGNVRISSERYRVVGNTLIVNMPGYLINARFSVSGNEMIVDADDFRAVLQRL